MKNVTISMETLEILIRNDERLEILKDMLKKSDYVSKEDTAIILGIDLEERKDEREQ